jgi:hypothetical protein
VVAPTLSQPQVPQTRWIVPGLGSLPRDTGEQTRLLSHSEGNLPWGNYPDRKLQASRLEVVRKASNLSTENIILAVSIDASETLGLITIIICYLHEVHQTRA